MSVASDQGVRPSVRGAEGIHTAKVCAVHPLRGTPGRWCLVDRRTRSLFESHTNINHTRDVEDVFACG